MLAVAALLPVPLSGQALRDDGPKPYTLAFGPSSQSPLAPTPTQGRGLSPTQSKAAAYGMIVGAVAGLVVGMVRASDADSNCGLPCIGKVPIKGLEVVASTFVGMLVGGGIGLLIGTAIDKNGYEHRVRAGLVLPL